MFILRRVAVQHMVLVVMAIAAPGTRAAPANAAPLGLELGVATLTQVRKALAGRTQLDDGGTNSYSQGPMLKSDGEGLDIEGLSELTLIFDRQEVLVGVLLTLPKTEGFGDLQNGGFKKVVKQLSSKYKLVRKAEPFVGDAYAEFNQGQSVIQLDAPHLGFEMTLNYLQVDFLRMYKAQSSKAQADKQRRQSNQL
ncbi:MAG: hypothetical protein RJA98_1019 [Pseudomonadota bacterium]